MLNYISAKFTEVLRYHQLDTFDAVWAQPVVWFEEPNVRRGGWSGVGTLALASPVAKSLVLFIKKQENHGRRTLRHPVRGEPTFKREFLRLQFLSAHHFVAPEVVFFGVSQTSNQQRAVLATKALAEFAPLDAELTSSYPAISFSRKKKLVCKLAHEIKRFHNLGLMHRALYPKHIFIKRVDDQLEIALIDLEKSRFSIFAWYRAFFDLSALNRHTEGVSNTQRLRFYKQYLNIDHLGILNKWFCRLIMRRSQR